MTASYVLTPGLGPSDDLVDALLDPRPLASTFEDGFGAPPASATRVEYDADDPRLPSGRAGKISRRDTDLAVLCAGHVVEALGLSPADLRDAGLFLATGPCQDPPLERQILELCSAYIRDADQGSEGERNGAFFRMLPPMAPLTGLSNLSACLIAQMYGVRGANSVFGVTSHAGHTALREGVRSVRRGTASLALVGGANAVGVLSRIIFRSFGSERGAIRECEGAAFLAIESFRDAEHNGRRPLCRVHSLRTAVRSGGTEGAGSDASTAEPTLPDCVIFGGSVFARDSEALARDAEKVSGNAHSWYPRSGGAGAASVLQDVATGARMIASGRANRVRCLNRDVFGRESVVDLDGVD